MLPALDCSKEENTSGFILVEPRLTVRGQSLPLDGIQCQTILSKCLGPFTEWDGIVAVSAAAGYNMVHFTPIQALGGSNSAYSLKDHMALNEAFKSANKRPPTFDDVKQFICDIEQKYNVSRVNVSLMNQESLLFCVSLLTCLFVYLLACLFGCFFTYLFVNLFVCVYWKSFNDRVYHRIRSYCR